jgi:hypothetical protein
MLDDPTLCYQTIAQHFGVTRQRIAQIAADMGVDGRGRQRQRKLLTAVLQREPNYPANVRLVIQKLKRAGLEVTPSTPTAKRTLLVNGVLCRVYCRRAAITKGRSGREYVRFMVGKRTRAVKVALFAFWRDQRLKLYVLPVRALQTLSSIWVPYTGRYAGGNKKKPKRDWTAYEEAWDQLDNSSQAKLTPSLY